MSQLPRLGFGRIVHVVALIFVPTTLGSATEPNHRFDVPAGDAAIALKQAAKPESSGGSHGAVGEELRRLNSSAREKLKAGAQTEADYADEISAYKRLLSQHVSTPETKAEIWLYWATFARDYLNEPEEMRRRLSHLAETYPTTEHGQRAKRMLHAMSPEGMAEAAAQRLVRQQTLQGAIGKSAKNFDFLWSSDSTYRRLSDLHGKVVVLDFWATWCAPCIRSFPLLREDVRHFSGMPVVFLGVTHPQGRVHGLEARPIDVKNDPAREFALTAQFMEKHDMIWPVVFGEKSVFEDYSIGSIPQIVIIAPDGTIRHLRINPHDADADIVGKVSAILREFNLPHPAPKE